MFTISEAVSAKDITTFSRLPRTIDRFAFKVDGNRTLSTALRAAKERIVSRNSFIFRNGNLRNLDEEIVKIKAIFNTARAADSAITLPDVNPFAKKMNGRLFPSGWFHLLSSHRHSEGARTFMPGGTPNNRNPGVDMAVVVETIRQGLSIGYGWSESSLVVESNLTVVRPIETWAGRAVQNLPDRQPLPFVAE